MSTTAATALLNADARFALSCVRGTAITCIRDFMLDDGDTKAFTAGRTYFVDQVLNDDAEPGVKLSNDLFNSHVLTGRILRSHFNPVSFSKPDDYSWISCRNGKWHMTDEDKPTWKDPQKSICGLSFTPRNVTWKEVPPTNETHVCAHCRDRAQRRASAAASHRSNT